MIEITTEENEIVSKRIRVEQINLLYSKSVARPALHIISIVIFLAITINHVNVTHAFTWAILLFGLNVFRLVDINKIQSSIEDKRDYVYLHKRFAICVGLLGMIYGLGTTYFFSYLPLLNQIYLLLLLSILTPAGLVSFATDKLTFNCYLYPLILPPIMWLFAQGQAEYFNIGLCAIIYLLVVKKLFNWNNAVLIEAITLKLENEQLIKSIQKVNTRLTELSVIDDLTQIANRRSLDETLEKEWHRAKRTKTPISMLMIDIDHFKEYNDDYGHIKGDECLTYVAKFMKENLNRSTDFIARYGGEEFCIIMPDTNLTGAINLAERIHSGIRELKISNPGSKVSKFLTVCVGIASTIPAVDDTYMDLVYTSDKALYKAKNDGRNIIRTTEALEKNPKPKLVV